MNTPFDDREPQGTQARLVDAIAAGGCNTCTRDSQKVWSIRGYGRHLEFRMCPACRTSSNKPSPPDTPSLITSDDGRPG